MKFSMTYAKKIIWINRIKIFVPLILILFFIGIDTGYISNESPYKLGLGLGGSILFILGFLYYPLNNKIVNKLDRIDDKLFNNIKNAELGIKGERLVFSELGKVLPAGYTLYKNYIIPGRKFDIDALIVGSKGIIIFEVKNLSNNLEIFDNRIFYNIDGQGFPMPINIDPRLEVDEHCQKLKQFLYKHNVKDLTINKAVVFTKNGSIHINSKKTWIYIINGVENINKYLTGLPIDSRFTPDFCKKIGSILKGKLVAGA